VGVRCKVQVCSRSIAGNAGSYPADSFDVRLLCLMYVVWQSLRPADHSFREVPLFLCVCVCVCVCMSNCV